MPLKIRGKKIERKIEAFKRKDLDKEQRKS